MGRETLSAEPRETVHHPRHQPHHGENEGLSTLLSSVFLSLGVFICCLLVSPSFSPACLFLHFVGLGIRCIHILTHSHTPLTHTTAESPAGFWAAEKVQLPRPVGAVD